MVQLAIILSGGFLGAFLVLGFMCTLALRSIDRSLAQIAYYLQNGRR